MSCVWLLLVFTFEVSLSLSMDEQDIVLLLFNGDLLRIIASIESGFGSSPVLRVLLLVILFLDWLFGPGDCHTACSNLDLGLSGHRSCLDLVRPLADSVISTLFCIGNVCAFLLASLKPFSCDSSHSGLNGSLLF